MTVLRSREIISPVRSKSSPETPKVSTPVKEALDNHEVTPSLVKTSEPLGLGLGLGLGTSRRRSLRLMSKESPEGKSREVRVSSVKRKKNVSGNDEVLEVKEDEKGEKGVCGTDRNDFELVVKRTRVSDCMRSEVRVSGDLGTEVENEENGGGEEVNINVDELAATVGEVVMVRDVSESESPSVFGNLENSKNGESGSAKKGKGKRDSDVGIEFSGSKCINLQSGKEIPNGSSPLLGVDRVKIDDDENEQKNNDMEIGSPNDKKRCSKEEKGKGKSVDDIVKPELRICVDTKIDDLVSKEPEETANILLNDENDTIGRRTRRFTREEKGKGEMTEEDLLKDNIEKVDFDISMEPKVEKMDEDVQLEGNVAINGEEQVLEANERANIAKRFHDVARRNASRFAHFSSQVEEENNSVNEGAQVSPKEADVAIEDWPGPFSTAWKIIRDRKLNADIQQKYSCSDKSNPVNWVPKNDDGFDRHKLLPPSLLDLCMKILIKNVDSIMSLEGVPDILRHKLCHLLCDCRKMNNNYLDLLVRGSPTEIRIRDCSWLSEEQFTEAFQGRELQNLMVLQLDQCGRCLPDYTLLSTLAQSPNILPALTTISLKGACRLSDIGLNSLISSAPSLRSINLSQCSLLTSEGITRLSEVLGSVLRELYLDDCQTLDAIEILPALANLESLEVLSLSGIPSVFDDFIAQFVAVRGQNLKELNLTDCTNLTDSSLKVIAEYCTGLRSINLTNLYKLTDSSIGYLANGCQAIQTLKLCRNSFSDEAIAAFLETCGESLNNLSLNNVTKVSYNTAISLSKRSINLVSLDLSWCRNLTNEALGLIVDNCLSLEELKLFGCTQITNVFLNGHSNPNVKIIGLKMSPILEHIKVPELQNPLHYSSVPFST